jgi:transcriptional regulator with XRE-family HTH domain
MISLKLEKLLMIGDDMVDKNTLAWRVMLAREEKGLKQIELVELMNRPPYNLGVSTGAYSKIETGDTKTPKHDVLIALSEILDTSIDMLVAGKEAGDQRAVDVFMTEEANRIGAMVDQLPLDDRRLIEEGIRILYEMRQAIRAQDQEIAERDNQIRRLHAEIHTLRTEKLALPKTQKSIPHEVDSTHE